MPLSSHCVDTIVFTLLGWRLIFRPDEDKVWLMKLQRLTAPEIKAEEGGRTFGITRDEREELHWKDANPLLKLPKLEMNDRAFVARKLAQTEALRDDPEYDLLYGLLQAGPFQAMGGTIFHTRLEVSAGPWNVEHHPGKGWIIWIDGSDEQKKALSSLTHPSTRTRSSENEESLAPSGLADLLMRHQLMRTAMRVLSDKGKPTPLVPDGLAFILENADYTHQAAAHHERVVELVEALDDFRWDTDVASDEPSYLEN